MKELSIEEKAKRYDEALGKARRYYEEYKTRDNIFYVEDMEDIFSELKESEDERMIKFISNELACLRATDEKGSDKYEELTNAIAWIGKQGEQKPANKVKPKFKVGDWVVSEHSGNTYQIHSIDDSNSNYIRYYCEPLFDNNNDILCFSEEMIHLWTIQDAKNGDVLANDNSIIIFRKIGNKTWNDVIDFYISYSYSNGIIVQKDKSHYGNANETTFKPALEEKRNLLFQKIKEKGYEWDAEKKKLKKIEQKVIWSEDDDRIFDKLMKYFDVKNRYYFNENDYNEARDWVKSIKERMQMQPMK